jgi:hypothetical protein
MYILYYEYIYSCRRVDLAVQDPVATATMKAKNAASKAKRYVIVNTPTHPDLAHLRHFFYSCSRAELAIQDPVAVATMKAKYAASKAER